MSNGKAIELTCKLSLSDALNRNLSCYDRFTWQMTDTTVKELSEAGKAALVERVEGNYMLAVKGNSWADVKEALEAKGIELQQEQEKIKAAEQAKITALLPDRDRVLAAKDNPKMLVDINEALKPSQFCQDDPANVDIIKLYRAKDGSQCYQYESSFTELFPETKPVLSAARDIKAKINSAFKNQCSAIRDQIKQAEKTAKEAKDKENKAGIKQLLSEEQLKRFDENLLPEKEIGQAIEKYVFAAFQDYATLDLSEYAIDHTEECNVDYLDRPFKQSTDDLKEMTAEEFEKYTNIKEAIKAIEALPGVTNVSNKPRIKTIECNDCGQDASANYIRVSVECYGHEVGKSIAI